MVYSLLAGECIARHVTGAEACEKDRLTLTLWSGLGSDRRYAIILRR
jgi:hypothetical protein